MTRMSRSTIAAVLGSLLAVPAHASLVDTVLTVEVQYQQAETSDRGAISFAETRRVGPGLEFLNLANNQIASNPFGLSVVPVSVDVGADYIDLDYSPAGSGGFASGFFNGYSFQFQGGIPVEFQGASIDPLTNLGVSDDDLAFGGDTILLDVASRSFNSEGLIRISVSSEGGGAPAGPGGENPDNPSIPVPAVPVPASLPLILGALGLLGLVRRQS